MVIKRKMEAYLKSEDGRYSNIRGFLHTTTFFTVLIKKRHMKKAFKPSSHKNIYPARFGRHSFF